MPSTTRRADPSHETVIETVEQYEIALETLAKLEREALGTPATEGLQDLIEAILDYEQRQRRPAGFPGALH